MDDKPKIIHTEEYIDDKNRRDALIRREKWNDYMKTVRIWIYAAFTIIFLYQLIKHLIIN